MDIITILLFYSLIACFVMICYWIDIALKSPIHFVLTFLVSLFLGWILVPIKIIIELVRLAKNI
jgi:hypothetical protein